jgi:hypothetical protein
MTMSHRRVGLIAGITALIGAAACNKSGPVTDDGLKRDLAAAGASGLELAPTASRPQVVVSAIEAGSTSAPKRSSSRRTPSPARRGATRVSPKQPRSPAPPPVPISAEAAPVAEPSPGEPTSAPITRPASSASPQHRVYKTEAEIFRDMPWIRP